MSDGRPPGIPYDPDDYSWAELQEPAMAESHKLGVMLPPSIIEARGLSYGDYGQQPAGLMLVRCSICAEHLLIGADELNARQVGSAYAYDHHGRFRLNCVTKKFECSRCVTRGLNLAPEGEIRP